MSSKAPPNAGTKENLPANIREIARLHDEVVAWIHSIYQAHHLQGYQYWVLSEKELKVISLDHDGCCIPAVSAELTTMSRQFL